MEEKIITFTANEQGLVKTGGISRYASDTISYIKAIFTLGDNWQGFDEVRAVFKSPYDCIPAVLDSNGECYVPVEVLLYKGKVRVNLVGSIVTETAITDRLTTHSVEALEIDEDVPICGNESKPISPSEYEQFVAKVANDANRAEASADEAEQSAQSASDSATASANSATSSAQSATASAQSAQNAQNSAISAENAKDDAEDARDTILGMRATATTLEAGLDATASYSDGLLTLGIPKGDKGEQGIQGETGATPNFSIGEVDTLEPNTPATASITGTAENLVLNLGIPQGRTGEVTYEDLESILPRDTATGNPVTITDGQNLIPVKSLEVELEPIQDLHGYDKPWAGGAGKNKLPMTLNGIKSANTGTWVGNAYTSNGITFTILIDEADDVIGINVSGTATANAYLNVATGFSVTTGQKLNGAPSSGRLFISNQSGATDYAGDLGNGGTVNADATDCRCYIQILNGTTVNNAVYKPMLREPTETDATYAPYSNICPISGRTEVVTQRTGINAWDEEWEVGSYSSTGQKVPTSGGRIRSINKIPVLPNTSYYALKGVYILCQYDKNEDFISFTQLGVDSPSNTNHVFTTGEKTRYITFATHANYGATYNHDISINYPSTDTDYHAYEGDTYTTTLGRTVYGGTLDVVSGELVVDRAMVDLGSRNWIKYSNYPNLFYAKDASIKQTGGSTILGNAVCSQYTICTETQIGGNGYTDGYFAISGKSARVWVNDPRYTDAPAFKTAMSGVQLCYELATPQTIQLTPQQVMLLTGDNNVWSDGQITMVYSADVQLWVEKKLNGTRTTLTMSRPALTETVDTETTAEEETAEAESESI